MISRHIRADELERCLALDPHAFGHESVGYTRALAAWQVLLKSRSFLHTAIESTDRSVYHFVAFASAVFVSDVFADEETARPRPGLNARIIGSLDAGRSVVLDETAVRRANSGGGLQLVILSPSATRHGPAVNALLAKGFVHEVQGYRLRRLLREATSQPAIDHMRAQKVFGTITTFDGERAFGVSEPRDATSVPGSIAAILFSYREPILRFRDIHQLLLIAALDGATDEELARRLGMTLPAIKKRWIAIFERVARLQPDLLVIADRDPDRQTRGPRKRHHLLAYLREHVEELRPLA